MTINNPANLTSEELVDVFTRLAIDKGQAILGDDNAKVTRIYWRIDAIKKELKNRPGDQRRLLAPLYQHRDPSVRLEVAHATLAVFPAEARKALQKICEWKEYPFTLSAGMALENLSLGIYKPT